MAHVRARLGVGWCGMARPISRVLAFALLVSSTPARADIMPAGGKKVSYTYEIANLAEHPEATFVVWPRRCGSDGEAVGTVDLGMNPQMAGHLHDVDYEVLRPGPRELLKFCAGSSHVYALDAKAFPADERVAAKDDWTLGWKAGDRYLGVLALDAMTIKTRMPFFASDPRARRADYTFAYVLVLRRASPIKAIHDVLRIESLDARKLVVAPMKVRYGYEDGTSEELAWTAGKHPRPPGKPDALKSPVFGGGADDQDYGEGDAAAPLVADAAAANGAEPSVAPPAAPSSSGSPWPMRTVLGGLVVAAVAALGFRARRKRS